LVVRFGPDVKLVAEWLHRNGLRQARSGMVKPGLFRTTRHAHLVLFRWWHSPTLPEIPVLGLGGHGSDAGAEEA
jgi:hypothetical protein